MSFKTITAILLVSCLGATGSSLGVSEEPPQDARVAALPVLTITDVRWTWTKTSTAVQICTDEELTAGLPTLILYFVIDGISDSVAVEGTIEQETPPKCAKFPEVPYKYTEIPIRYELTLKDASDPPSALGRGVTTFAITVETTLLTCGGLKITKLTWTEKEKLVDIACLEKPLGLSKVCYHNKDLTATEFCITVKDTKEKDVNVCLNGPTDSQPPNDGAVSVNYFYYEPDNVNTVPADATLSMVMDIAAQDKLRAIVRRTDDPATLTIYGCSGTECTLNKYIPKFATNEVCVEEMDENLVTLKTATTTFIDLNLHVFDGGSQKSLLLESVFANGLTGQKYKATLYRDLLSDIGEGADHLNFANLDCTSVDPGHACFGFLDTLDGTDTVYLAVSGTDYANTIIVPFAIPPPILA